MQLGTATGESGLRLNAGSIPLLLLFAVLTVYAQVFGFEFVSFDDGLYVTRNAQVQTGLNLNTVRWAFTTTYGGNWHPLTWLSHAMDVTLFGLRPGAHHAVNVALHAANTVLLFRILRRASGEELLSGVVALLFAIHPLHVESVAWVAERKDVLSTGFLLLGFHAWLRYRERPTMLRYMAVLGAQCMSLMAKPMGVTFPILLLLLDFWPLGRFDGARPRAVFREARATIPMFLVSLAFGVVAILAQHGSGAVASAGEIPFPYRACNAALSVFQYLGATLWPLNLAAFYPHPAFGVSVPLATAAMLGIAGLTWAAVRLRRVCPAFLVGWLWYLVTLAPVLGLLQVGGQGRADRYTYLPLVGIFLILAWSGRELLRRWTALQRPALVTGAGLLLVLGLLAHHQVGVWRTSETLWTHAAGAIPRNWFAYQSLGETWAKQGRAAEAAAAYRRVLEILPDGAAPKFVAHLKLGDLEWALGHRDEAGRQFQRALELEPGYVFAHFKLAVLRMDMGMHADAVPHLQRVLLAPPRQLAEDLGFAETVRGQARARLEWITRRTGVAMIPEGMASPQGGEPLASSPEGVSRGRRP